MQEKAPPDPGPLTYAEFLEYCAGRDGYFEYVDGRAVAMAPASDVHQRISSRLLFGIAPVADANGCEALPTVGLWTIAERRQRIPDLVVFCEGRKPKLVLEVMSANRGDDLEDKLDEYAGLPSIEEYVVVDSTKRSVRIFRRNGDAKFSVERLHIAGTVRLASIGFSLDIDALYAGSGVA